MLSKLKVKVLNFIIIIAITSVLVACQGEKEAENVSQTQEKQVAENKKENITIETEDKEATNDYGKLNEEGKEKYDIVKNHIEKNLPYEISVQKYTSDGQRINYNTEGEIPYDFNGDGKIETLKYKIGLSNNQDNGTPINCELTMGNDTIVHKTTEESYEMEISEIGIIDVDKNDKYVDFYINEGYLSGGVSVIYRYVDEKIKKIGECRGIVATSGDGKVYYWGGNLHENYEVFDENLVLEYYDINKNEYVETNQIIGKKLKAPFEIKVYTKDGALEINGSPMMEDEIEKATKGKLVDLIKKNDEFTVIDLSDGVTKVKTNNGKEGWVGGFHMVWD
ncbi:MAG TPA: hypothetical protein DCP90_04200 [Clostridiales bacterium]|nr:MAG: hypothetical protein A2Y22_03925 [Clostridiales bacterium GWD2_32_59]HAN09797.1 hypothetical protein [Clostridiales bacterium]